MNLQEKRWNYSYMWNNNSCITKKCKIKIISAVKTAIIMFEHKSVCLCIGATQTKKNSWLNLTVLVLNKVNVSICTYDYKTCILLEFWCRILQWFYT